LLNPPRHEVPVRKPSFQFDKSIPNHWIDDNVFATHVFNGLNLVFPDGERFFIQAVRDRLRDDLEPALREQVKGFVGQEARHAHEHERYFDTLRTQGYRIDTFLGHFRRFIRVSTRWLPAPLRLAMTAGAEHWTATLGAAALRPGVMTNLDPTMERLILWHALEEIEHKNVAFDVLQATHPSHLLRVTGYVIATLLLFGWTGFATRMLLRQERLSRTEIATERRRMRAQAQPAVLRTVRQSALAYFRRDFHPSQIDDLPLAHSRLPDIGLADAAHGITTEATPAA
jgi:predicted metal-dependent hydrolase